MLSIPVKGVQEDTKVVSDFRYGCDSFEIASRGKAEGLSIFPKQDTVGQMVR